MNALNLFRSLKNPVFARLYAAQTTSLLGDALTWVGLALLAFEIAGKNSAVVLASALTLRVTAFVFLSPLAGAIADRYDRKRIMVITHVARMLIVSLLPFVTQAWHIYGLILALNVFNAFFTPTYQATISLVTEPDEYLQAIALSSATYQLLGVLGPGLAGSVAAFMGARQVFFLDALSFLVAAVLIVTLPGKLRVAQNQSVRTAGKTWQDIKEGTTRLLTDPPIRYALAMQLVASIAGAQILVNTVGYVQGTLHLGNQQYGWVMAAFGIGATLASIGFGSFAQRLARTTFALMGAALITIALLPASAASLPLLMAFWLVAGAGQSWVNLPTQTLIADRIPKEIQGRVYGAHFAWSHLWWAFSYPLAGWLGSSFPHNSFFWGGLVGLGLLTIIQLTLSPRQRPLIISETERSSVEQREQPTIWHDHSHVHDEHHQHQHASGILASKPHAHAHTHDLRHLHSF